LVQYHFAYLLILIERLPIVHLLLVGIELYLNSKKDLELEEQTSQAQIMHRQLMQVNPCVKTSHASYIHTTAYED
jgi:hypothetical protein